MVITVCPSLIFDIPKMSCFPSKWAMMVYLRSMQTSITIIILLDRNMTCIGLLLVLGAAFTSVLAINNTRGICPIWHYLDKGECKCGNDLHWAILGARGQVYIKVNFGLSIWNNQTVAATTRYVSYNYNTISQQLTMYVPIPKHLSSNQTELEHFMCSGNDRMGFFCSQCIQNHGPSAYSSKCYKCDRSLISVLALSLVIQLLPAFTMFILIATFRINITKGPMLGYIISCQMYIVAAREASQFHTIVLAYLNIYKPIFIAAEILASVWSLDFLQLSGLVPQFCISDKLSDLDVLLLNFVRSVTFPFLLAIFTYFLIQLHRWNCRVVVLCWKPFHLCFGRVRRTFSASDKAIHAFASLWFLSFIKLNYSAYDLMHSVDVYLPNTTTKVMTNILYNDPRVHYQSAKYTNYSCDLSPIFRCHTITPSCVVFNKVVQNKTRALLF